MRVGYVGGLNLTGSERVQSDCVKRLVSESESGSIDFLVISGGISNDYHITLSFVDRLGKQLDDIGIKLRFIVGNSDCYYPIEESTLSKESKFREILGLYHNSKYYLPTHPIFTRDTRILGAETWYDYSLYRGKPKELKDITRKQLFLFKHKDNSYITDPSDYTLGIDNVFDTRYCRECLRKLEGDIRSQYSRHGACENLIVVTYFKGSKALLSDSMLSKYFGAFEGSLRISEILSALKVTQNIYGLPSTKEIVKLNGVSYINTSEKVKVFEYV